MSNVGIYVLTYPGDYYLSVPLIESLKHFAPDTPLMIIPGEGFNQQDHPFDIEVMPQPQGFWGTIRHADRKFWAFQGPFEKFIYLDADIICTRPVKTFVEALAKYDRQTLGVQLPVDDAKWRSIIADPGHADHTEYVKRVHSQLGNVALLREFDPDFDPFAHYPFNNGLFAGSRLIIEEDAFRELYAREQEFFRRRLGKPFDWKAFDLFFGDQGRMNYLVSRLGIERTSLFPYGNYQWGGDTARIPVDTVLGGSSTFNFIHWAGCPRPSPSLFCRSPLLFLQSLAYPDLPADYKTLREIPGYSVWKYFSNASGKKPAKLSDRFRWTLRDARKISSRLLWLMRTKPGLKRKQ